MKIEPKSLPLQPEPQSPTKQIEDIKEAAQKFEAYLTSQLFKQVSKISEEVGNSPSLATNFFQENFAVHAADLSAARGELGLAKILVQAWTPASLSELLEAKNTIKENNLENNTTKSELSPKESLTRDDEWGEQHDSEIEQ